MTEKTPENTDTPKQEAPVEPEEKIEKKEEDLDTRIKKIAQAEADRVRTEYAKKLRKVEEENEILKKERMSENERREYEASQLKEALEIKERDLTHREMQLLAVKALEEKHLPASFIDFVVDGDQEKTLGRIAQLEKVFSEEIKKTVDLRMKDVGRTLNKGRVSDGTSDFSGMTPADIQRKAREDPVWWDKNQEAIIEHFKKGDPNKVYVNATK